MRFDRKASIEIRSDSSYHGKGTQVIVDGVDISRLIIALDIHSAVGDANKAVLQTETTLETLLAIIDMKQEGPLAFKVAAPNMAGGFYYGRGATIPDALRDLLRDIEEDPS